MLAACNLHHNTYHYIEDIFALDHTRPNPPTPQPAYAIVTSPFHTHERSRQLAAYRDQAFVDYVLRGITQGFRIGFAYSRAIHSAKTNMRSASEHPQIIEEYICTELAAGRLAGPLSHNQRAAVQTSPIGVIPKKPSDKWHLIVDLSSPSGYSVNDGIARDLCSIQYSGIDEAIAIIQNLGRGCLLEKFDLKTRTILSRKTGTY